MSKRLEEWLETDVRPYREKSVAWLSQHHFFRDPVRANHSDMDLFFSPADGIIVYQQVLGPEEPILNLKGRAYTLRDALRMPHFDQTCLVIGIFMTFFDVHVNRIPYPGLLSWRELDALDTYNHPMLPLECDILEDLRINPENLGYLQHNQRMLNRVFASVLGFDYYILQIADYDVDCITPFLVKQNQPVYQGMRFSVVRYGSQVDLVVPVDPLPHFTVLQDTGTHVEAGVDPLVRLSGWQ